MRSISEIANWYKNNNILSDEIRINILSLYTIVAYKISNIDIEYNEITFSKDSFDIGIESINNDIIFSKEELQILKTINHVYGYEDIKYLLKHLSYIENPTIDNIIKFLYKEIKEYLEGFIYYDFDEYDLLLGNNVFFVKTDTTLSEEEKIELSCYDFQDQDSFLVFRNDDGKLVVY